jgi:hypothetical protein
MPVKVVTHKNGLREEIVYGKATSKDDCTFGIGPPVRMVAANQLSAHRQGRSTVEVQALPKSAS